MPRKPSKKAEKAEDTPVIPVKSLEIDSKTIMALLANKPLGSSVEGYSLVPKTKVADNPAVRLVEPEAGVTAPNGVYYALTIEV